MAIHGKSRERIVNALSKWEACANSNKTFRGYRVNGPVSMRGDLPEPYRTDIVTDRPVYVVWSYSTPIAWITNAGQCVIPDVKYSPTTSNHQGLCRAYLKSLDFDKVAWLRRD